MQTRKKCRHCNTVNTPDVLYCVACGKYLTSDISNETDSQNMVGYECKSATFTSDSGSISNLSTNDTSHNSEYVAICPVCRNINLTQKDILPMTCSKCNYFFQLGLDQVVSKASIPKDSMSLNDINTTISDQIKKDEPISPSTVQPHKKPMPSVKNDNTQLRLFWMNRINEMPILIPHNGATLGSKGVLLKTLPDNTLFMIWHTPAGWYLRVLQGHIVYNGSPINLNIDRRLLNNDFLIVCNEQFRVEVI